MPWKRESTQVLLQQCSTHHPVHHCPHLSKHHSTPTTDVCESVPYGYGPIGTMCLLPLNGLGLGRGVQPNGLSNPVVAVSQADGELQMGPRRECEPSRLSSARPHGVRLLTPSTLMPGQPCHGQQDVQWMALGGCRPCVPSSPEDIVWKLDIQRRAAQTRNRCRLRMAAVRPWKKAHKGQNVSLVRQKYRCLVERRHQQGQG